MLWHDAIATVSAILVDRGGVDHCSENRKQLIRRFAAAAVIAEQMEAKLANGGPINITEHAQLASTLVRIAQRIGINRRAKDITPALPDYLDAAEADDEFCRSETVGAVPGWRPILRQPGRRHWRTQLARYA